ncbi:leucine-rich repeat domain-containing protein [Peptococcaceae bacterium]|nr:leucine-rich repeat domain-containing protein [Peptococcaceae bacterium]
MLIRTNKLINRFIFTILIFALVFLLALLVFNDDRDRNRDGGSTVPAPDWPTVTFVDFPDPALEAAVREAIYHPEGFITTCHLRGIRTLEAGNRGIENLSGLEYMTDLDVINLEGNQIRDISPLVANTGLDDWDMVFLTGNPLDTTPGSKNMRDIETLEERGVIVSLVLPDPALEDLGPPRVKDIVSEKISAAEGDTIVITEAMNQNLAGLEIIIPPGALAEDTTITVGEVYGKVTPLPAADIPLTFIANLAPAGLKFKKPVTLKVPLPEFLRGENIMSEDIVLKRYNKEKNEWISIPVIAIQDNKAVVEISDFNPYVLLVIPGKRVASVIVRIPSREALDELKELKEHVKEIVSGTAVSEAISVFVYYLLTHIFVDGKPVNIEDDNLRSAIENAIEAVVETEEKHEEITNWITCAMLACENREAVEKFFKRVGLSSEDVEKILRTTNHANITTVISGMLETEDFLTKERLVTDVNMTFLRSLTADSREIKYLDGLEYASNLRYLSLGGNQITDITPLDGLTNLTWLNLRRNQITDIIPLAGLTNLITLRLWDNQITDITPLVDNTGLGYDDIIWLNNNPLDLTPGSQDMQDIETLQARGVIVYFDEVVEPVDPYGVVTFLDANLEAAIRDALRKPTGDITKVDMAELINLEADRRGITNLSGLEYAVNLTSLQLEDNQITDITPLAGLTNLTKLSLEDNQITDITPLAGLTNMTTLDLTANQITDITPLAGLTNLTRLYLAVNQITDITPLAGVTNLTMLDLEENQITDITPLAGLTNLT